MPRSTNKPVISKPVVNNSPIQNRLAGNQQPSLFSTIKQGFGFGIGSSIAHNIFDSKEVKPMHPVTDATREVKPLHPVTDATREFKQCMEKTYNNYEECAPILK